MTKAEYARHRGVKPPYIYQLIKQGKIILEYDGRIDPVKADAALGPIKHQLIELPMRQQGKEPKLKPRSIPVEISLSEGIEISAAKILASTTLFEAQQYKEIYNALTKKLEYEKLDGSLLFREEVEKSVFETGRQIRDMLQAIPDRIAPLVASETDLHACTQILKTEIRAILESMCDAISSE